MSLLGLDIGTTGCKIIAFSEDGTELSRAYREYPLSYPRPGWVEMSAQLLWENVRQALTEVNSNVRQDPVTALAVSCHGEAVVPIGKSGEELGSFIITFDSRTQPQNDWWRDNVGAERIFEITGMPLHPMYSINKIMWLKENAPSTYQQTRRFLCVEDYIIYRLSGEFATDYSLAARTMAFDVVARNWSDEILEFAGVDRASLPPTLPSGTGVGQVKPDVAAELGFEGMVIVATGGHDQPCGALGAGIVIPGMAVNATGTSDVICPALSEPVLTTDMLGSNYCCYPHTCDDLYCSIGINLTGGLLLRWYRDIACGQEIEKARKGGEDPYDLILSDMSAEPGDVFILPHFVGSGTPYLDPKSRGAIVGLTLDTGKPELTRAVVDSINFEMKTNIERMERAGIDIRELRAIGGGAKSDRWLQMKADVFGKPVASLQVSEAASFGAAILAGKAKSIFKSASEAAQSLVKVGEVYEPNMDQHRIYEDKYRKYTDIYAMLSDFNHGLGKC